MYRNSREVAFGTRAHLIQEQVKVVKTTEFCDIMPVRLIKIRV